MTKDYEKNSGIFQKNPAIIQEQGELILKRPELMKMTNKISVYNILILPQEKALKF